MPDLRTRAVGAAAGLAGAPWRLNHALGKPVPLDSPLLHRIVLIKPCCMGDLLMSTPAIAALRRALPESHISMSVGEWSRPAVANNPRLSAIIDASVAGRDNAFASYLRMSRYIRRGQYGAAIVLDRSPLLNAVPLMARVPVRAGLDSDGRGVGLTHAVPCPPGKVQHEVQWYLDVVSALGVPVSADNAFLEFFPTEDDKKAAGQALSEALHDGVSDGGIVALHLGGGVNPGMDLPAKRWRPELWARIADWLAESYEPNIILLGGPGEVDREAAEEFKAALFSSTRPYMSDLVGKLSWGEMGALLERAALFLGHDTGAMHLATAVRTPVVAVFGPSDPARYGPWDPSGRSVAVAPERKGASDAEALRHAAGSGEKYHSMVQPEQVWEAIQETYKSRQTGALHNPK